MNGIQWKAESQATLAMGHHGDNNQLSQDPSCDCGEGTQCWPGCHHSPSAHGLLALGSCMLALGLVFRWLSGSEGQSHILGWRWGALGFVISAGVATEAPLLLVPARISEYTIYREDKRMACAPMWLHCDTYKLSTSALPWALLSWRQSHLLSDFLQDHGTGWFDKLLAWRYCPLLSCVWNPANIPPP